MNQRKAGSIITYAQMVLTMIVSIAYTPYMIKMLGQSEYGLYNTAASTISMLSILNLGFGGGYIRYYSIYKQNNDKESICKLNGMFIKIFTVIGFVGLICGLYIANHLETVFKDGLTPDEYSLAKILMILLTVNLAVSFPMSVFSNIISAHERFVLLKLVGIMKTVCGPLVTIPLLFAGFRSVAIVVVTLGFSLTADAIYIYYVLHVLKERFLWSGCEKGLFKELAIYTSFIAANIIVDQINWNIGRLLLARYKGTVAVAVYTVGYTLNTYYNTVSTAVSSVFTPMVHGIVNRFKDNKTEQKKELTSVFTRVGRIQFLILGLFASGLVLFGKQFIAFWAGKGFDNAYFVVLLLAIPATIPLIQNVGIEMQRAMNKHQFRSIAYLIMALLNLTASIYLCQLWGEIGSAVGTGASMIIANGIAMNIYYHKKCNIDVLYFWKNIVRMLPGILIPLILFAALNHWVKLPNSLVMLAAQILVYTVLYCGFVWFMSMNEYEKNLIYQMLRRVKKERSVND